MDEKGKTLISAKGKTVLKPSYSVLQDDFFHAMRAAGYTDVERGERGSTEEHLTVTQFKVAQEQQRFEDITAQVEKSQQTLAKADAAKEKKEKELSALEEKTKVAKQEALIIMEIESMGKKTLTGNITMTQAECRTLKEYAVSSFAEKAEKLKYKQQYEQATKEAHIWKKKYINLKEKAQPYLDALEIASEKVRAFLSVILARGKMEPERKQPTHSRKRDMEI